MDKLYYVIIVLFTILFFTIRHYWNNWMLLRSVTQLRRGTHSELKLLLKLLKQDIPHATLYHDLYLEKLDNNYAQIDAIMLTDAGILVFEVKDYKGWIFGNCFQYYWLQSLAYGKQKNKFYNPVMQNRSHIDALRRKLRTSADVPYYSIVVFYGECKLKNIEYIPDNTHVIRANRLKKTVRKIVKNHPDCNYKNRAEIERILKEAVRNGDDKSIREQHIKNTQKLIERHSHGWLYNLLFGHWR